MGKMAHNTQIKHSSHPHLLQLSASNQLPSVSLNCAGCNLHISPNDHVYTCRPCNFFLHMSCSKFPQLITHPSHREHALSLICTPIYPGGCFKCDACTQHGTRFSYHCHTCDFDLHVLCSSKPLSVNTHVHHHPLVLTFSSPYGEKEGFSCDVCKNAGLSGQWLYCCVSCGFDVHLDCATSKLHHNLSFPGASPVAHPNQYVVAGQPLAHSLSTGHAPANWQPQQQQIYAPAGGFQGYQQPSQPQPQLQPYQMVPQQPQLVGIQNYQMQQQQQQRQQQLLLQQQQQQLQLQQQQLRQQQLQQQQLQQQQLQQQQLQQQQLQQQQPGLADVMVTGFVDGMCQQLGQDFVQSLTGGGDGGGGGGGDAGGGFSFECSAE